MAKILIAASREPRAVLERLLEGHELVFAGTMSEAAIALERDDLEQIVCTVLFDESRMFDLLRLAKSKPQSSQIPFVCTRMRPNVVPEPIARKGIAYACKALGAADFLDVADYGGNPDREMRAAIERLIPSVEF